MRLTGTAALVLGVTAGAVLAGCGGTAQPRTDRVAAPSTASASASVPAAPSRTVDARPLRTPAASGPLVAGTGYRFRAPAGWHDVTAKLSQRGVDRAAAARLATHGFTSNVNVVVTAGELDAAQLATVTENIRARMRATAPSYRVRPGWLVDGEAAGHLSGLRSKASPPYWLEQVVMSHGGSAYVVSFSFSPRVPAHRRERTVESVLAAWSWR